MAVFTVSVEDKTTPYYIYVTHIPADAIPSRLEKEEHFIAVLKLLFPRCVEIKYLKTCGYSDVWSAEVMKIPWKYCFFTM